MTIDFDDLQRRMKGAISALENDFLGLRTGRASTNMLDPLTVDAYGSVMPLNQLGNISVPESRLLTIQVWDQGLVASVEKAIRESDLGLNPQTEGTLIRLPIPDLSAERRQELAKVAGKYAEQARIAVRNIRRDGMDSAKKLEKNSEIGEDERRNIETKIQEMTDDAVSKVDAMLATKESDIKKV